MKNIFTFFHFMLLGLCCSAQNYAVGNRNIVYTDAARANRQIATSLYYPADIAGSNAALAAGTSRFPVVVFGHGFVIPGSAYQWLADSLVKNGYIVAFPSTESGLSPSHASFGEDLLFLCNRITSLNDSASSFLFQRIIPKAAVGGHSMGGGCSFLAATGASSSIQAIFNFAAAETNPSAISAASQVNKPALIFSGTADCIVLPSVQQNMYNAMPASCKTYINITDALHCQFANNNGTCAFGQLTTGCNSSSITPATVFNKATTLLIPFLDYYLKDICFRGDDYTLAYNTITGVVKSQLCAVPPGCGPLPVTLSSFTGHFAEKKVMLKWNTTNELGLKNFVVEKSDEGSSFLPLLQMPAKAGISAPANYAATDNDPFPGYTFYRLKMIDNDGRFKYSTILKVATGSEGLLIRHYFPNPVKNELHLNIRAGKSQSIRVNITEMSGKKLIQRVVQLHAGNNEILINTSMLAAGSYILYGIDELGQKVGAVKLVKD